MGKGFNLVFVSYCRCELDCGSCCASSSAVCYAYESGPKVLQRLNCIIDYIYGFVFLWRKYFERNDRLVFCVQFPYFHILLLFHCGRESEIFPLAPSLSSIITKSPDIPGRFIPQSSADSMS